MRTSGEAGRAPFRWPWSGSFRHGVHPPQAKGETAALAIRQFPFAPRLVVPLSQHIGKPALPVVREGQEVVRGEVLAEPDGFLSVAMHAPVSGVVREIGLTPTVAGTMVPAVVLESSPGSGQEVPEGIPCPTDASPEEIIAAVQRAGIVGLGGAGFPTHAKLRIPAGKSVETLIINGVECEPYLTTDHRVMLEQRDDILRGIRYLLRACGAREVIVGIEENKPDAAQHLAQDLPSDLPIRVATLPVKYPQGAEKMLITALLGREVPSGALPLDVHALCINVATAAEIGRLLPHGRGIQDRIVTISGPAVVKKGNYRVPIGTPLRFLLEQVGVTGEVDRVFLGGPMMGPAVSKLDVVVTKGTSGVIAFDAAATEPGHQREYPCIRCGYCLDACPIFLDPSRLGALAGQRAFERMAEEGALMDCFECGACSYVCPSHIPLVQRFREAKIAVRKMAAARAEREES